MADKENKELKALRVKNGLTLEGMAKIIGIAMDTYRLKEKGIRQFTEDEINKILTYFDVRYEDIFCPRFH